MKAGLLLTQRLAILSYHLWYKPEPPGGRLNVKMPSHQYRDSHDKDLYNENPLTWKDICYIETEPRALIQYKDDILPV